MTEVDRRRIAPRSFRARSFFAFDRKHECPGVRRSKKIDDFATRTRLGWGERLLVVIPSIDTIGCAVPDQHESPDTTFEEFATSLDKVAKQIMLIQRGLEDATRQAQPLIDAVDSECRRSATNLVHYVALRRHDMRVLQDQLSEIGLSSLGRSESHVAFALSAVLRNLRLLQAHGPTSVGAEAAVGYREGQSLLVRNTERLLGSRSRARRVRIMVTAASELADDPEMMRVMLESGMDCLRINCAHDGPEEWLRMIANLRAAEATVGRHCRVMMDLAGPKLRTGPMKDGPPVVKWRPRRDEYGRVVSPARIWLSNGQPGNVPEGMDAVLPVDPLWLETLRSGDKISLNDTRNARRFLDISTTQAGGCVATCHDTTYVTNGTQIVAEPRGNEPTRSTVLTDLPPTSASILLRRGDSLKLPRSLKPGHDAEVGNPAGGPAEVGCTLPEVFSNVREKDRIWFDDGQIGGHVTNVVADHLVVLVTEARPNGSRLRAEKGINLPDTDLPVSALTSKDLDDLTFAVQHADLIGLSFVREASDVHLLQERIETLGKRRPGIVLKIETRQAFESLPELILAAMRSSSAGIMIARGDLAVEVGYERLAEIQEEILWIAEAAHMPVIWATQVLESLAQTGKASRSEITDAAMGGRAECVMLNKGPHIEAAISALDIILRRMQTHQEKKRPLLRRLKAWTPDA